MQIRNIQRNIVLCLLLTMLISGCMTYQPPAKMTTGDLKPLEFSEVITAEGLTKDQLYSAAQAWFGNTFRSAKTVFDVQDPVAGRIIGKPLFQYEPSKFLGSARIRGVVRYSVTIEVKDGRYRYFIGNFIHEGSSSVNSGMVLSPFSFGLLTQAEFCPYSMVEFNESHANDTWRDLKERANTEAKVLIVDLKKNMTKPVIKNDW
jgi:hypothetical protein